MAPRKFLTVLFMSLHGVNKIENSTLPIAFFIQHDLTPVKNVWEPPTPEFKRIVATMLEMVRETDILKENVQPILCSVPLNVMTYLVFLNRNFLACI